MPLAWTEEEAKRGKALDLSSDSNIDNISSSTNSNSNSNNNNSIGNNNVQNDDNDLDATRVLYLTENYKLAKPLHMRAKVVEVSVRQRRDGFTDGEFGSRRNLSKLAKGVERRYKSREKHSGVYFGYCQLEGDESGKKIAVLNVVDALRS